MFGNLVKMELKQNFVLFSGVAVGIAMGMFQLFAVWSGFPPYEPFEFAPCIVFLTTAALVWTKILYDLMGRSFQAPGSSLMMTLPVLEETMVQSKIFTGTMAGFILAVIAGLLSLYLGALEHDLDVLLTSIASMYVDLTYPAWVAAVSMGLIPILVALEQFFFCGLLLMTTLIMRRTALLQKCTILVYMVLMGVQIWLAIWLITNYEVFIGRMHPFIIAGVLLAVFGLGAMACYQSCIRYLKYKYQD